MPEIIFTTVTEIETRTTHYYRTDMNPHGTWDSEGRVDSRVRTEELDRETWLVERELYNLMRG